MTIIIGRDGLHIRMEDDGPKDCKTMAVGSLVVSSKMGDRKVIGELLNSDGLVLWETGDTLRLEASELDYAGSFHSLNRINSAKQKLATAHSELAAARLAKPLALGDYVTKPGSKDLGRIVFMLPSALVMVMWASGKMDAFANTTPLVRADGFSDEVIADAKIKIDEAMEKIEATTSFPYDEDNSWREIILSDIIPDGSRKGKARFSEVSDSEILMRQLVSPYTVRLVGYGDVRAVFVNETSVAKGLTIAEGEELFKSTVSNIESVSEGGEITPDMAYYLRRGALIKSKNYDPKKVGDKVLVDDHRIVHAWYSRLSRGKPVGNWTLKEVIDIHGMIVEEMSDRGFKHDTPLPPTKNRSLLDEAYFKILALEEELRSPPIKEVGDVESPADWFNKVSQALNWMALAVQKLIRVYRIDEANALLDFMFQVMNMTDIAENEKFAQHFNKLIRLRSQGENMVLSGMAEIDASREIDFEMAEMDEADWDSYDELVDPYMEVPPEDGKYNYVMQYHWRGIDEKGGDKEGASVHTDWRMEINGHLVGWTLSDPKSGGLEPRISNEPGMDGNKILSFTKSRQPKDWLTLADDGEFWAPPGAIGATKNTWGSLEVLDKGTVEFGAQKSDYHEYWLSGKKFNGQFVVRKLKNIWGGRAGKEPFVWMAWKTKSQVPHVLSDRAIDFEWMPPKGISAMPASWRKKIPPKLRWWSKELTGKQAHDMRVAAVEFLKAKKDLETGLKSTKFTLHYRWWKGPTVIRGQPVEFWDLSFGEGDGVRIWTLDGNPLFSPEDTFNTASVFSDDKDWLKKQGELKPGEFGNPNKKLPVTLEILDTGSVSIIEDSENFKSMKFNGSKLKGFWVFKRKPGEDLWEFKKSELPGKEKKNTTSDDLRLMAEKLSKPEKAELSAMPELVHHRLTVTCLAAKSLKTNLSSGSKLKLPLVIEGIALEEGRHHGVWYPGKIVAESAPLLEFQRLQLEHGDQAMDVIGWVTKAWGEDGMRIKFEALVYDEKSAKDILDGKKRAVSVGVWIEEKGTPEGRVVKKIQRYDELTVTDSPECPTCEMRPKKGGK